MAQTPINAFSARVNALPLEQYDPRDATDYSLSPEEAVTVSGGSALDQNSHNVDT
jgi:hypothetical protein